MACTRAIIFLLVIALTAALPTPLQEDNSNKNVTATTVPVNSSLSTGESKKTFECGDGSGSPEYSEQEKALCKNNSKDVIVDGSVDSEDETKSRESDDAMSSARDSDDKSVSSSNSIQVGKLAKTCYVAKNFTILYTE